jgi:hypothetical protein
MLPINKSNNQQNCNPISSNCVTWQGPDIACINLQKGDTISDVTYKLAVELCDILDQTNLTGFDLTCFDPICPKPENFHDLVQFIIDKLCALNAASPVSASAFSVASSSALTTGTCPDCTINIAPCFYYTDQYGNNITTMLLADYAAAIGAKVCTLATQFAGLQTTVGSQGTRITNLENQFANLVIPVPTVFSTCLSPGNNVDVNIFCQQLETAFCALRTAVGQPASISTAISQQCAGLDNLPSLSNPATVMGLIPGWVNQTNYGTAADAINNLWLTVCDLRTALQNVLNTCCNDSAVCATVVVEMSVATISTGVVSITYTGTVPTAFSDCTSGLSLIIRDKYNVSYTVTPIVISNVNGSAVTYSIGATSLQQWSDLDVTLNMCAYDSATGLTCTSVKTASINNSGMPFVVTPAPATTEIDFSVANSASSVSSTLNTIISVLLYAADQETILETKTYTNNTSATINDTFSGLTTGTQYYVQSKLQIGSYIKAGTLQSVVTS